LSRQRVSFKRTIRKFLKMLAYLSLGLVYSLVTLAITTFIVTMSFEEKNKY
jgi:hypothetical protein